MPMIEALAGDAPVDFLGHSFGAVLALAFAVKWPGRVRSLILYEPVLFAAAERAGRPEMTVNHERMAPFGKRSRQMIPRRRHGHSPGYGAPARSGKACRQSSANISSTALA